MLQADLEALRLRVLVQVHAQAAEEVRQARVEADLGAQFAQPGVGEPGHAPVLDVGEQVVQVGGVGMDRHPLPG